MACANVVEVRLRAEVARLSVIAPVDVPPITIVPEPLASMVMFVFEPLSIAAMATVPPVLEPTILMPAAWEAVEASTEKAGVVAPLRPTASAVADADEIATVLEAVIVVNAPVLGVVAPTVPLRLAVVMVAPVMVGLTSDALLDSTILPVPVTALERVTPPYVKAPASVVVVPTHRAFCVDIPPAVKIEPVVADVASVTSVELMPCANRMREVVVVCPSFVIAVDRPVAKSAVSALNAVDDMTVPVTTGWPAVVMLNVPEPL